MRQWIICCYIVEGFIGYGALSLGFLGFHEFPHVRCLIFFLVGGFVGEAFILHLELSSVVFDVVYLEGSQSVDV